MPRQTESIIAYRKSRKSRGPSFSGPRFIDYGKTKKQTKTKTKQTNRLNKQTNKKKTKKKNPKKTPKKTNKQTNKKTNKKNPEKTKTKLLEIFQIPYFSEFYNPKNL